jgi:hypothetical protein
VPDERACLLALEYVLRWLPDVLALSANSPFADGADSGLRSARAERLAELPNGGAPPVFHTWADWEARTAGVDYRRLHWDVRPHPDYGTLEVRIADQQTDVRRSAAFAALIQALVTASTAADVEPYARELYRERRRRAAVEPPDTSALREAVESTAMIRGLLESPPEAERQLEIGLPGVVRDLRDRSPHMTAVTTETLRSAESAASAASTASPRRSGSRGPRGGERQPDGPGDAVLGRGTNEPGGPAEAMAQGGFHVLAASPGGIACIRAR